MIPRVRRIADMADLGQARAICSRGANRVVRYLGLAGRDRCDRTRK